MNKLQTQRLPKKVNKEFMFRVRFDKMDVQKLEELSKRMNCSRSEVIRTLISEA